MKSFNFYFCDLTSAAAKVCVVDCSEYVKRSLGSAARIKFNPKISAGVDTEIVMSDAVATINLQKLQGKKILVDPKPSNIPHLKSFSMLVVGSVEQKIFYSRYHGNIKIYRMFPRFDWATLKGGTERRNIVYHGNLIHLNNFFCKHITAMERLASEFDLNLSLIYNVRELGKWTLFENRLRKSGINISHLQWYENCYKDYFTKDSIGIVPNYNFKLIPDFFYSSLMPPGINKNIFHINKFDFNFHYKHTSNLGRCFPFSVFGIPFVVEPTVETGQFFEHGENCLFASNSLDWYLSLRKILSDPYLYQSLSVEVKKVFDNYNQLSEFEAVFLSDEPAASNSEIPAIQDFSRSTFNVMGPVLIYYIVQTLSRIRTKMGIEKK